MTGDTELTAPLEVQNDSASLRARRDERRRARRRRRIGAGVAAGVVAITVAGLVGATGDGIPAKVFVAGVDVGGLSVDSARTRLTDHANTVLKGDVRVTTGENPDLVLTVPTAQLASQPKLDEAIAAARSSRSRVGTALARLGLAGRKDVPLRYTVRGAAITKFINTAQAKVGRKPVSATVAVKGTEIVTTPAKPGRAINRRLLAQRLATLPPSVELPVEDARPPGDDDDAARARDLALRLTARSRDVTFGDRSALLVPAVVRKALRFPLTKDSIDVALDTDVLREVLVRPLAVNERPPADATFAIRGNRVAVVPSKLGRRLNARALSAALVRSPDAPTVEATIATAKPKFTTADAKALGIKEKISEFTTPYDCCPPRVTNIRRAAQILNRTIIPAGNRFSLNDALGQRTTERGFVEAPTIAAGELVDSVGGGVSQVATTLYNAAFFGGLELIAHTPHEFYISRYPRGREATVSWRTPDLVFRNDWDAAILMSVSAGNNGVTVAFYSSKLGRRVETTTGEPSNFTQPKTIERNKPDLPPGTRKVIQSAGPQGFTISYTRKVFRGDTLRREQTFRWTYRPENAIVEVGPPAPEPPDEPTEPDPDEPGGTPTAPTTPTTPTAPSATGTTPTTTSP